jgi:hypothetical protein
MREKSSMWELLMLDQERQLRDYTPEMMSSAWEFFDIFDSCVKIQRGFEI